MYIVRVLKRKDAASVVVAIVLGFILIEILSVVTLDLSSYLSGITANADLNWRQYVVQPIIAAFLKVIVLEAILRTIIYVRPYFVRRTVSKKKK